jgi:hypothetical protein
MLTKAVGTTDGQNGWLSDEYVRFQHPMYPDRWIYVATCSAHGIKALRNALLGSRDGGPKQFQMRGSNGACVEASWHFVEDQRARDQQRVSEGLSPATALNAESVAVDGYARMRVRLAKQIFDGKTISEGVTYAISVLEEASKLAVGDALKKWMAEQKEARSTRRREGRAVLGELMDKVFWLSENYSCHWPAGLPNIFPTLEFEVVCGSIFNETLLNKKIKITNETIDSIEKHLRRCLKWFNTWQSFQHEQRSAGDEKWCTYFIAAQTWSNLRRTVCGFLSFCRYVLGLLPSGSKANIPALRSTTSSLESTFGTIKGMNNNLLTLQAFMDRSAMLDTRDEVTPRGNHFGYSMEETSGSWVRRPTNRKSVKETVYSLSGETLTEPLVSDVANDVGPIEHQQADNDNDYHVLEQEEVELSSDDEYYDVSDAGCDGSPLDCEIDEPEEQQHHKQQTSDERNQDEDTNMNCELSDDASGIRNLADDFGRQSNECGVENELELEEQMQHELAAYEVYKQEELREAEEQQERELRELNEQLEIDTSMCDYLASTEGGKHLMSKLIFVIYIP